MNQLVYLVRQLLITRLPTVRSRLRVVVAVIAISWFVWTFATVLWDKWQIVDAISMVPPRRFNDLTRQAIELQMSSSDGLFHFGLLLIGALWGLFIARKGEVRIALAEGAELALFAATSAFLLASFVYHWIYVDNLVSVYSVAGATTAPSSLTTIPDVFSPKFAYALDAQVTFLKRGFFTAVATVAAATYMKDDTRANL